MTDLMTALIMVKTQTMREQFSPHIRGHFKMELLKSGKVFERPNTIMPSAIEIMTGRLAGIYSSNVDYIQIYNLGLLKGHRLIQSTTKVSFNEVEFFTIFDELDFDGDFDEARLICAAIGSFAAVTGLVQNKPSDEKLAITWKIKLV